MEIAVSNLCFSYGKRQVLFDITLDPIRSGEIIVLIGPNAAGKTTFFKCLTGMVLGRGSIMIDGREARSLNQVELSRRIAYMPQDNLANLSMTVFEAVLLARQFNASWRVSNQDLVEVHDLLTRLHIDHLALRQLNELSGGQRQMVSIGQALVRHPEAIILDEPTNNLDMQRQLELLDLVTAVTHQRQLISILALHDLNLAARVADRIILFDQGRVRAFGPVANVVTRDMLEQVFGVHANVTTDGRGIPSVSPITSIRQHDWSFAAPTKPV